MGGTSVAPAPGEAEAAECEPWTLAGAKASMEKGEGMKFDRGYISPYFATDPKTQVFDVEDPLILLVEKKVSSIQSIVPLLETVVKAQRPLLVVAEDVEAAALATLVVTKLRAGI